MTETSLLDRLRTLVAERYVFPDIAEQIVAALPADANGTPDAIATDLTATLQSVNSDRHLRVRARRSGTVAHIDDWEGHFAAEARRTAGGLARVERLPDGTGVLAIAPHMSPVHVAQRYVGAAFDLLAGIDRLVIDLRAGHGGTPETVALICGYLLGNEALHLQDLVERDGTTRQFWTSPATGGLADDVAISVLTAHSTFSGCEELAYDLQALGRATVIGERTGGGAHPCEIFALTDLLEVTVPVARSVNAVTGTNWEGVGVVPDVECAQAEALDVALHGR